MKIVIRIFGDEPFILEDSPGNLEKVIQSISNWKHGHCRGVTIRDPQTDNVVYLSGRYIVSIFVG